MPNPNNFSSITGYSSIDSVMGHITDVLYEAFPCRTWMITTRTANGWLVTHVKDNAYDIQINDLLLDDNYQTPLFEDGVSTLFGQVSVIFERANERVLCRSVKGVVFHRIISQTGDVFGAIIGFSNRKIGRGVQRFTPLLGLLSETLMLSYKMCSELQFTSQAHAAAERDAQHDPLTGLLNLRGWEQSVDYEVKRQSRAKTPLSFLMIDIDNFKAFNDNGGHARGDAILRSVALILKDNVRETDRVARLGGDEFAILACDTGYEAANRMAKSLERVLLDENVSCSIGVAEVEKSASWRTALEAADRVMYKNKKRPRPNVY